MYPHVSRHSYYNVDDINWYACIRIVNPYKLLRSVEFAAAIIVHRIENKFYAVITNRK